MADIEQISLEELQVEQIVLASESGGLNQVMVKNTLGTTIATVVDEEYIIPDTSINLLDENNVELETDSYVFGTDKIIEVINLSDSMVHIGPTAPEDTNKIWIQKN